MSDDLTSFNFTAPQAEAFKELKDQAVEAGGLDGHTDRDLARFLVHTAFDAKAAAKQVADYLKWRLDSKIDSVLDTNYKNHEVISTVIPYAYHGNDKEGRPVYYEKTGQIACGAMQHATQDEVTGSHIWGMEHIRKNLCPEASKKAGKYIDQFSCVIDLTGLSLGHRAAIPFLQGSSEVDKKYYPGKVGQILIVNSPWVFPMLYKLVQMFLDEDTKSKVHVLAGDAGEALSKFIDKKELPAEYGGDGGVCIPVKDSTKYQGPVDDGLLKMNVAAGAKTELELKCDVAGSTLSWFFQSEGDYDVDFSATLHTPDGKTIPLKINSRCVTSKGSYVSTGPCTVKFLWDNSFSYMYSKDIKYLLDCTAMELSLE